MRLARKGAEAWPARCGGDFRSPRKPAGPAFRQPRSSPESPAAAPKNYFIRVNPTAISTVGLPGEAKYGRGKILRFYNRGRRKILRFYNRGRRKILRLYLRVTTTEISTLAPLGSWATATVSRAGNAVLKRRA